jgi:hypothetical protein
MVMGSLKEWLETRPAAAVAGLVVSIGTTASGITAYSIGETHKAEKIELTTKLNAQISDLSGRLSSIERRAGPNNQKKYFDVQTLQISSPEVRNLAPGYANFENGSFFVNAPISDAWTYGVLTEGDVGRMGPFKSLIDRFVELNTDAKAFLETTKVHVWRGKSVADVTFDFGSGVGKMTVSGLLTPHVSIMKVSRRDLIDKATAAAGLMASTPTSKSKEGVAQSTVEQIERLKAGIVKKEGEAAESDSLTQMRLAMERLYDGDVAGFIFVDALLRMLQYSLSSPTVSFGIHSAQKQLNVLYIDAELRISEVEFKNSVDPNCKEATKGVVVLRREYFFLSFGDGGYLIQTEVSSCDGRSKAFDWISQWLAGLRFTVKTLG